MRRWRWVAERAARWLAAGAIASTFAGVLGTSRSAQADEVARTTSMDAAAPKTTRAPRNAISLQLLSLFNSGVALQYERYTGPSRVSLATALGVRQSGGDAFDVLETAFGFEGRYWLVGRMPFTGFHERAMVGPYLGARLDFGITRVDQGGRVLGASWALAESVSIGLRVALAGRVELTPHLGVGLRTEVDPTGRLAPWTRAELFRFGMTVGVLF